MSTTRTPESRGYLFTVDDAADALRMSRAAVLDLVRLGTLSHLGWSARPGEPPGCFLDPDEVEDFGSRRALDELSTFETVRPAALEAIRGYLAARPPVGDYDDAVSRGLPLWSSTKGGERALNLRVESVMSWHQSGTLSDPMTTSALTGALEQVGAVRVRGVVPYDERGGSGKQRWATWWRVPVSLLAPADGDAGAVLADAVDGVREPGEKVSVRRAGRPFLVDPLGVDS